MSFSFVHPWALLLLALLPAYVFYARRWRTAALTFSRAGTLAATLGRSARLFWLAKLPDWLRAGLIAFLIVALAGPRTGVSAVDIESEGINIVLTLDISSSMLAEDLGPGQTG